MCCSTSYTFFISVSIILRMWNVSNKTCRESQNTYFMLNKFFLKKSHRLCDNVEKCCRAGQATDDNTAHAYWKLDTYGYKYTLSGCVILTAFPRPQYLHERASMLRYTYLARLIYTNKLAWFSEVSHDFTNISKIIFDFVYKDQHVFFNLDYNTRVSWWLNVKFVIRVKTLYWTYASLKMVQNELKRVKDGAI